MLNILAAVAFAITFSSCTVTITVELKECTPEACEICSACLIDLEYLDDPIYSNPTFGAPRHCVDYCVECYTGESSRSIDVELADSLAVDFF